MTRFKVFVLALLLLSIPCFAILGVGDIVHDPISYANALVMLAELVRNYEQLTAQLELATRMAQTVPVEMSGRYGTIGTSWYGLAVPFDRFGNLNAWLSAVNGAVDAQGGYNAASLELQPFGPSFAKLSPAEQARVASRYASVELTDGTNVHSMETIGQMRSNAALVDQAVAQLEADSLSMDPAMNTEVAVLNKINAGTVALLRSTRDTNRLNLSVLEQQLAESKLRRDAHVSEWNVQIARQERGAEAKAEFTSTIGQTLRTFRWK